MVPSPQEPPGGGPGILRAACDLGAAVGFLWGGCSGPSGRWECREAGSCLLSCVEVRPGPGRAAVWLLCGVWRGLTRTALQRRTLAACPWVCSRTWAEARRPLGPVLGLPTGCAPSYPQTLEAEQAPSPCPKGGVEPRKLPDAPEQPRRATLPHPDDSCVHHGALLFPLERKIHVTVQQKVS